MEAGSIVSGCVLLASESNGTTQAIVVRDDTFVLVSASAETTDGEQGTKSESRAQQQTPMQQGSTSTRGRQLKPPGVHQKSVSRRESIFSQQCSVFNRI